MEESEEPAVVEDHRPPIPSSAYLFPGVIRETFTSINHIWNYTNNLCTCTPPNVNVVPSCGLIRYKVVRSFPGRE